MMSSNKFLLGSNQYETEGLSSNKKKLNTPALLFCKSNSKQNKFTNENNSSAINTNKSPIRQLQLQKAQAPKFSRNSPLNSKDTSQSRSTFINGKSQIHETSMIESVHYCQNHENKQATYISSLYENNFQYYCDKCAILLASQGYSVQKICDTINESRALEQSRNTLNLSAISQKSSKSNRSMLSNSRAHNNSIHNSFNRRQQINRFLNLTKDLMGQIDYKKQQIHQNLIQSEQFYGMQIQQVNEYFQLVFKSLELEKNKCYNYILNQRLQVQQPVRMINQMIGQLKQKITTIIQDIQENIETVYQTADDIYRPVIEQYQQNYEDIHMKLSKIQINPIQMRKIDFQGVPQSIFYLSDILKDSIQNSCQFVQNQKKMNEQLDSLRQSMKENFPQIQPRMLFTKKSSQQKKNFCFSFEAEALRQQLSDQKIIYQTQQ